MTPRRSGADDLVSLMYRRLKPSHDLSLAELRGMWEALSRVDGRRPRVVELLAERILRIGEPLFGYDVIQAGLAKWPRRIRLRQLEGLALARSGATQRANHALQALYREEPPDGETLGILARTYKDLWERETDPKTRAGLLSRSHEIYREAFEFADANRHRDAAIYTGINAASTSMLAGRTRLARSLARRVRERCRSRLRRGPDYWARASLGEAAIILGELEEAERHYSSAAELGRRNLQDLSSTRRQARALLDRTGQDASWLDPIFSLPRVVVFAGHMIDGPGRKEPRFPAKLELAVGREIAAKLKEIDAGIGYASAACGADILFHEAMIRRGKDVHVVLPFSEDEFRTTSVEIVEGGNWGRRYDRVLKRAASVTIASLHLDRGSDLTYEFDNKFLDGLGSLRARALDCDLVALAVWDTRPGDGPGGTASCVTHWRAQGRDIHIVSLAKEGPAPGRAPARSRSRARPRRKTERQRLMAMLFADVVGYSQLTEEQNPLFVEHFLGGVSSVMTQSGDRPVTRNTWGDALYFVFASIAKAGRLALDLVDFMHRTDWKRLGLPADLNLRVALHAGPVFECRDPVVGRRSFTGSHVNQAARIEPVTPPGQVYGSQGFAALAESDGIRDFSCDYVGRTQLAKGYGTFPMYHVRRTG